MLAENRKPEVLDSERGVTIVENLVALVIIAIAAFSVVPLLRISLNTTAAARTHSALVAEVEDIVADYRSTPLIAVLGDINSNLGAINDGDTATAEIHSDVARARYDITVTAIKSTAVGSPRAARLRIEATHRRGVLGDANYVFETVLADAT